MELRFVRNWKDDPGEIVRGGGQKNNKEKKPSSKK